MKLKQTPKNQRKMEKEKQSRRYHISWFQSRLQSYSNPNSMVLVKNSGTYPSGIKKESPGINSCIYGQLMYNKGAKDINGKTQSVQQIVLRKLDTK